MKLIVGLGNPGAKYEKTRHNIGFRVVRAFHTLHAEYFDGWKAKHSALVSEGHINGDKIVLLLPQTFMNVSGQAVREAADFWKIAPEDIVIVNDDFSLPLGRLRVRREGSAGGHNGLKSIFERMGTKEIPRLRVGIANELLDKIPPEKFVLEPFSNDDETTLSTVLPHAADAIKLILHYGLDEAMNKFN